MGKYLKYKNESNTLHNIQILTMKKNEDQITVEGIQTLLDGTQRKFNMDLDAFTISVGMPLTIGDLSELPILLKGFAKASTFTVTKVNL